jgi:hypothetical protein
LRLGCHTLQSRRECSPPLTPLPLAGEGLLNNLVKSCQRHVMLLQFDGNYCANNKPTSMKLLTIWLIYFPIIIALLLAAAYVFFAYFDGIGMLVMVLAWFGEARIQEGLAQYLLPFILTVLTIAAILSTGITIVAAIIF